METSRFTPLPAETASYLLDGLSAEEDWRVVLPYVPGGRRGGALAILALTEELANIPARVSEPMLGAIRFQWWREALEEVFGPAPVRKHPLAQALDAAFARTPGLRAPLEALVDGAETALGAERPSSAGEAVALLLPLYGRSSEALASHLGGEAEGLGRAAALHAACRARQGGGHQGQARQGRGQPRLADLVSAAEIPDGTMLEEVRQARQGLGGLDAALMPAALPFTLAPAYARGRRLSGLAKRWRYFRAMLTGRL
ncbi:squalene/phytoene synthase family protein [Parvularcula oceani]|uniref:squalene/phytoene synthase family protein n=1 Tax=Parvularcula oceani TaxID=1247963 RepID=UPI0004E1FC30|nr:squalene/phytoene synthase family protein [Parvularcula oceani]